MRSRIVRVVPETLLRMTPEPSVATAHPPRRFLPLALGSIGVVFGDIGTSPLYAFKEAVGQAAKDGLTPPEVMGVVSLALWALIIVVTVKYVVFLMRADNRGEGGVLSLMALAQRAVGRRTPLILMLGLGGAALFYGDAVITPAISVLSAIEGLRSVPAIADHITLGVVLSITIAILVGLFLIQSSGTSKVARFFGPICLLWFAVIAVLGAIHLRDAPGIVMSINPYFGARFMLDHGMAGLLVMGSVFLTVTGAEALYADMGHFGRWPIQSSWFFIVLPALILNYLGQGALTLATLHKVTEQGQAFQNLDWFFLLAPEMLRAPLVVLAACATVIASQAVITGAFSLSQQAIQLGLLPRMTLLRTSETEAGQIYVPQINLLLLVGVILLVGVFKTSTGLAQAYGLAVTGTMVVTTSLAIIVVRRLWKWSLLATVALIGPLLLVDLVFLGSNALKLLSGGWIPLVIGGSLMVLMGVWVKGSRLLQEKRRQDSLPLDDFLKLIAPRAKRVPGAAVYLTADPAVTPGALLHNLKHNNVLHDRNVLLAVEIDDAPRVSDADRLTYETLSEGFSIVRLRYGFMERPSIPRGMLLLRKQGVTFDVMNTSFFLGRRTVVAGRSSKLARWQEKLFIFLTKNAASPTDFFQIPPGRVVELGAQTTV
ncbi:potassium transporter Kup [Phenylobacterium sp. 20VBR1]|uniref:Probable potassium transport system protein Kup n=2 Tax=Phenylobacterium glaciei TaxID=2803784 RepID=A0A941HXJ3_9CAUL|nr:potassium transporter Kup [Phenylobacterium glaciei]